jgi:hypothetical protein
MRLDPVMRELYENKEALAAKYQFDLHALAESFRRSPTWKPVKKPARLIHAAERRFRRLTAEDEILRELWEVKESIAAERDRGLGKTTGSAPRRRGKRRAKHDSGTAMEGLKSNLRSAAFRAAKGKSVNTRNGKH